jgi:hypothetical protein
MKKVIFSVFTLALIGVIVGCKKEETVTMVDNKVTAIDLTKQLAALPEGDTLRIHAQSLDSGKVKISILQRGNTKASQQTFIGDSKTRYNYSIDNINARTFTCELTAISYKPGRCIANALKILPYDLYTHVYSNYRGYIKKKSCTVGPLAKSYYCSPIGTAEFWYSSPRWKSVKLLASDVSGYTIGGFTVDNDDWGSTPNSECNIDIY